MRTILEVFGSLEGLLLLGCAAAFIWGAFRGWEMEIPMAFAFYGTLTLAVAFLLAVVFHDHVHFTLVSR